MNRAVLALMLLGASLGAGVAASAPASAAPGDLTIVPIEWNVVGLDSNSPSTGPRNFHHGAKVCNTTPVAMAAVTVRWVWDSASTAVTLDGPSTRGPSTLAANTCRSVWFGLAVSPVRSSYDAARRYHIEATALDGSTASTPVPREIYVEKLVSQNRNSIERPVGAATVYQNRTYTYTVSGSTAPGGYEQLVAQPYFSPSIFEIQSVSVVLSVGSPTSAFYNDACTWQNIPTAANYRNCIGTGKAGDQVRIAVVVKVVGTGTSSVSALFYDFSGASYHYNSDFGSSVDSLAVTALPPVPNTAPVAVDDDRSTPYEQPLTINVLRNDTDPEGDTLSTTSVTTPPTHGTAVVELDGTVTYTPSPGHDGEDVFEYEISDGQGGTDTAWVTVTTSAAGANTTPNARADVATTITNTAVTIPVQGNDIDPDGDTLSTTSVTQPANGQVVIETDGRVTYTPDTDFTGTDTFTYTISDGNGGTATATVTVTTAPNTAPVAVDDDAETQSASPVTIPVPGNDSDSDGHTLTTTSVTQPVNGEVVIETDGTVTYTPDPDFTGTDTFTYTVSDGHGGAATATVSVTVRTGPSATPDSASTPQDTDVTLSPTSTDAPGDRADGTVGAFDHDTLVFPDVVGHPGTITDSGLTLTVIGEGVWTIDPATGVVTFDPEPAFDGLASAVTYEVADQAGNSVSSTIEVRVRAIVPSATDDSASTPYAGAVTLSGATDDSPGSDPNGTPDDTSDDVSPALVPSATVFPSTGQPSGSTVSDAGKTLAVPGQGTWVVRTNGSVVFTPAAGFAGTTSPVVYQVEDVNGTTDTANLTVTVRTGPTAGDDTGTTPHDVDITLQVLGNDNPGQAADGTAGTTDAGSVRLVLTSNLPAGSALSADGKSLVVAGQGTYTASPDGTITFDPLASFAGVASPVTYAVTDSLGNAASATITVTVTAGPATPTAAPTPTSGPVPQGGSFDLMLDKRVVSGAQATIGSQVRYRLQVSNTGTAAAPGPLRLSDPLPAGLELVSARGKGWTCTVRTAADKVACLRSRPLGADREAPPVIVVARATKEATGRVVVNVAAVSVAGTTANAADRDQASITIVPAQLPSTGLRAAAAGA